MESMIIRGLPPKARFKIQRMARSENLSINQLVIRLLVGAIQQSEKEEEKGDGRTEAFRRLEEFREKMKKKYGRQEESWKLIREDRDSR